MFNELRKHISEIGRYTRFEFVTLKVWQPEKGNGIKFDAKFKLGGFPFRISGWWDSDGLGVWQCVPFKVGEVVQTDAETPTWLKDLGNTHSTTDFTADYSKAKWNCAVCSIQYMSALDLVEHMVKSHDVFVHGWPSLKGWRDVDPLG